MNNLLAKTKLYITTGSVAALAFAAMPFGAPAVSQAQADCQTFQQTGKQVCGKFLAYWRGHGGLPIQGYPISAEMQEKSDTDGKVYTVQYFERAVFELHPENKAPFDVLLSLLGAQFYKQKYPNGAPGQVANKSTGSVFFPETSANLGGQFLAYWQATGGLMQHGYPISQEFTEKSELNGQTYKVQYFQRAVFEFHPENPRASQVLLSQLGTYQYNRKYPGGTIPPPGRAVAMGEWGGQQIALQVTAEQSRFELGCAHAVVKGVIQLDASGKFNTQGNFTYEGGPVYNDDSRTFPATIAGTVTADNTMTVTFTVNKPGETQTFGPFTLVLGKQATLFKCQ